MAELNLFNKYGAVYDEGKLIFKEGEEGLKMYIIQEGNVRITKTINDAEHILAVLGKGDFLGEMAIVNKVRRTANAIAATTVKLLAFDRQGFLSMIEKNATIALSVIDKLCRRLQQANMQIKHLVKRDERCLVAMNLYYVFSEMGDKTDADLSKTLREICLSLELSYNVVMTRLEEFQRKEIINIAGNRICLINKEKLKAQADQADCA